MEFFDIWTDGIVHCKSLIRALTQKKDNVIFSVKYEFILF